MRSTRVVAAAVKHDEKIYEGRRHSEIMRCIWDEFGPVKITQDQQGFVTDSGEFLNRFQAAALAFQSGQTRGLKRPLFSEDLW